MKLFILPAARFVCLMMALALAFPVIPTTQAQTSPLCNDIIDIALVLDRSASMDGQKLLDAKDAANSFIDLLNPAAHRTGMISFSNYATIEADLTTNYASVKSAVDSLNAFGNTYIDEAIDTANNYLSWRGSESDKYIILMSDGLPSGNTEGLVRQAADNAKAAGIRFFTVGLGIEVDGILMSEIASAPSMYYHPLNSESLRAVYQHIAANLCCGNGIIETGLMEDCDDGNQVDGDGCNARCEYEYRDIGLRMAEDGIAQTIAVLPSGQTSPLRVAKDGQIYHIALTDIGSQFASAIRIKTRDGIRAIRKLLTGDDFVEPLFFIQ